LFTRNFNYSVHRKNALDFLKMDCKDILFFLKCKPDV
jgi:hypothetical protein